MKIDRKDCLFYSILAGAIILVFGSAVSFKSMVMDDIIYVGRFHLLEPTVNNLKLWWQPVLGLWGPLTGYSFMLDYLILGKDHILAGAHAVNILLHFTACAAFYTGARLLKFSRLTAGLAVLFWAVHPQRAESVAWLSERKDVMLLVLGLWSIVFFIKSLREKNQTFYCLAVIFFALSFAVKPALIGLPVVLTVFLWGRYRKKDGRFYFKYTGIFWLLSLIYYGAFKYVSSAENLSGAEKFSDQFILMGWRYGSYLVKTFVPYGLNPYYPHFSLAENSLLPLYIAGMLWLLLAVFLLRKNKKVLYLYLPLALSFSAAVAPGLLRIGSVDFADRYSYFPSVFSVLALFAGVSALWKYFPKAKNAVIFLSCGIIIFFGALCFDGVFIWESEETFSAATLNVPKPNYRRLIADTVGKFEKQDFSGTRRNIDFLRRNYANDPAPCPLTIQLFTDSLEGVLMVEEGNIRLGMRKIYQVLSNSRWKLLFNTTWGYPRFLLLKAAGHSQRAGYIKDAAELYRRVADLYSPMEPMEKEFYLALAALCQGDRQTALWRFENAHRLNPGDENIRKNIEILRKNTTAAK